MSRPLGSIPFVSSLPVTILAATFLMLRPSSAQADDAKQAADDSAGMADAMGQAVWTLQAAQRDMASAPLDEDGVIDRVGRDPAKLCQWVRSNIAYEPYRGFLKGGRGALVSGRANSADKALLLADLLIKAGFKAQLLQGDAAPGAPSVGVAQGADSSGAPDEKTLAELAKHTGIPADRIRQLQQAAACDAAEFNERLWNRTLGDVQTLAALLDQSRIPAPPLTIATAPADHWWVRIPSGDLDPTFDAAPGNSGTAFDPKALPATEYHQVTVRIMIRQDNTPAKVVESSYRSAEVFGRTLTIANLPLDTFAKLAAIDNSTIEKVLDVLATASKFQPEIMLSGTNGPESGKLVSGKGFDLTGAQFDVSHGQVQSAQGMGGGLGGMFGGGGGRAKANTKLTGAWIEIELTSPGQPPVLIRRDLFVDSPSLTPRQKVLDLLATREILLLPEDLSDQFTTSLMLDSVGQWAQYLSQHAQSSVVGMDVKSYQGRPKLNSTLFAFAVARRSALRQLCDGRFGVTAFAHARPTAVSYVSRFIHGDSPIALRSIDILENTILPAAAAPKPAAQGWAGNFGLACGVLDTALEHEVLRNGQTHQNASVTLEQALLEGNAPAVVSRALPADLKLTQTARATIEPELARSAFVIVPSDPAAWYRVGLDNGTTLGFVEGGGGQEAAEYGEMGEIMTQLNEAVEMYGDLGRCLGAAISNPLVGKTDPHENLEECFKALCDAIPGQIKELTEVEAVTWQDKILLGSLNQAWKGMCEKLWDKLAPGEGGGGGGGGGE